MDKKREVAPESLMIENPFEKTKVEDFNDNYNLIAYLFAKPGRAVYEKLVGRDNLIIVGGWGSGKTMLLKYLGLQTQIEVGVENAKSLDFVGVYVKTGRTAIKPFLKPGGEFKEGGEALFGHYFNLLVLENIVSVILYGKSKGVFNISPGEEEDLYQRVKSKFSLISQEKPRVGFRPSTARAGLQQIRDEAGHYRREVETFLNIRDLEQSLSYKSHLSIQPTNIRTFLDEVVKCIKETIPNLCQKRFYILLDECELCSKGQQKVVNTLIKQRLPTMTFKLATRPPDIQTIETIDEGIGLTDRECKHLYLDKEYDPTSASFKQLCKEIARKRLEKYGYSITDIRTILGEYDVEDEIAKEEIVSYLKENYPSKERVSDEAKFRTVHKDYKVAATFQILRKKGLAKKYAGFDTFVMLSSGIMLHFLELCRDTFSLSFEKDILRDKSGKIIFKQIPLRTEIQDKAATSVSGEFHRNIMGRAESLKAPPFNMEFGGKIQRIIAVLGGIFREKLMGFNEPEAARIEIPEGISALDNSPGNPIRQLFTTAIAISVFQEDTAYMPRHVGGVRPPTYILNRILAPHYKISPRPRWRTQIPAEVFNNILKVEDHEFKNEVLRRRKKKRKEVEETKKAEPVPQAQLALPLFQLSESMPVLSYLSSKIKSEPFKGKTLLILLHFLRDLIPFVEACRKAGALPADTMIFYKDYQYPNKGEIEEYLRRGGYTIYPIREVDDALERFNLGGFGSAIIIEDGGVIVPKVERDFQELAATTLGAVEQTTRGIHNDQQIEKLSFPLISIPGSELKDTFEPPHVARAIINNISRLLPDKNFSGRKALVVGYGNIGEQVALQIRDTLKMKVSIYDLDDTKLLKAQQCGFDIEESLRDGVKQKFLIIGATGEAVIGTHEILAMEHNVYLISASSEQWEFCVSELNALSSAKDDLLYNGEKIGTRYKIRNTEKYVNLIADGYPINFWHAESMPNEVSDLIMSLIFISAVEIATNTSLQAGIDYEITNALAKRYALDKIYLEYHSK